MTNFFRISRDEMIGIAAVGAGFAATIGSVFGFSLTSLFGKVEAVLALVP